MSPELFDPTSPIAAAIPEITLRLTTNLSQISPLDEAPLDSLIRFKRHHKARWDIETKRFIPLENPHWEWDSTVAVVTTADDLVERMSDGTLTDWVKDIRLILGLSATDQMIVIIKGLQSYYAKTKTMVNREFTAAARAGLAGKHMTHGAASTLR